MLGKGKNNVFLRLKQTLNKNILGMGYCVHIIHNSIQYASDCLPVDVDSIVCKIFGFFIYILFVLKNLKNFVTMLTFSTKIYFLIIKQDGSLYVQPWKE